MPKEFIQSVAPHAVKVGKENNILPSLIIAQACLESNWGRSGLASQGHNLFGVKGDYNGESVTFNTREHSKSRGWYYVKAPFRKYPSYAESIYDLCSLYNRLPRYANVVGQKNYVQAAGHVQRGGYATDPDYASKLIFIIEKHELFTYDKGGNVDKKEAAKSDKKYKVVKSGDTLSKMFGQDWPRVAKLNNITGKYVIHPGQKIYY